MKTEQTHTPGPWKTATHGNGKKQLPIYGADGTEIAALTGGHLADAALIAAAPDLLALLKIVNEECRVCRGDCSVCPLLQNDIPDTIAKAEGN